MDHRADNLIRFNQCQALSSDDIAEIKMTLLRAFPEFIKPSFHPKNYGKPFPIGEMLMLGITRKNQIISKLFDYLYSPQDNLYLIFKEVGCLNLCINLLKTNGFLIIYLVHHLCAVIHSLIEGRRKGLMASGRRNILERLLPERVTNE